MTPAVICSIVFGTVTAMLTLLTILQNFLQRKTRGLDTEAQRYRYYQHSLRIYRRLVETVDIYSWNVGQTQDATWAMPEQSPTSLPRPGSCFHQDELELRAAAGVYV